MACLGEPRPLHPAQSSPEKVSLLNWGGGLGRRKLYPLPALHLGETLTQNISRPHPRAQTHL